MAGSRILGLHLGANGDTNRGVRLDRLRKVIHPTHEVTTTESSDYADGNHDTRQDEWEDHIETDWRLTETEVWEDRILIGKQERRFLSKQSAYVEFKPKTGEYWADASDDEISSQGYSDYDYDEDTQESATPESFSVRPTSAIVASTMSNDAKKRALPKAKPAKQDFRLGARTAPESPLRAKNTPSTPSTTNQTSVTESAKSGGTRSDSTMLRPRKPSTQPSPLSTASSPDSTTGAMPTKPRKQRTRASRSKRRAASAGQSPPKQK